MEEMEVLGRERRDGGQRKRVERGCRQLRQLSLLFVTVQAILVLKRTLWRWIFKTTVDNRLIANSIWLKRNLDEDGGHKDLINDNSWFPIVFFLHYVSPPCLIMFPVITSITQIKSNKTTKSEEFLDFSLYVKRHLI